jgi:hypothetical protein
VKTGHVVPDISLERVKQRLAEVRGALVECPMVRFDCHFGAKSLLKSSLM